MTVSILIPTLGRTKELIDTVSALMEQTVVPDEIVIADQNSPEIAEVTSFLKSIRQVKHIRNIPKGVVPNYNLCLNEASGEIIIFVDDDIVPRPNLIENHLKNYQVKSGETTPLGGVAGRVKNAFGDPDPSKVSVVGTYIRWSGAVKGGFNALKERPVQFAQGANMSYRREALLKIGGFDRTFDGNGYFFETDGGLRLLKAGYRMIFDPNAEVDHLLASSGGARVHDKAVHTYFFVKNGTKLYKRHSPRLGLPVFVIGRLGYLLAKALYNLNLSILTRGLKGLREGLAEGPLHT